MSKLMPDERVLWQGRPAWRAVARDVLRLGWVAAYFAAMLIWQAASNRSDGLGPVDTLWAGLPLAVLSVLLLGAGLGFAWAIGRTTTYTITTERCILRYGVALGATLSLPLRRIAEVSVAAASDGTGSIPLRLKPGARVQYLKLWPHVRPWRTSRAEPMLRGVADVMTVAATLSQAVAGVMPGALHAVPARKARQGAMVDATSPAIGG